jgi:hypothetical protein
MKTMFFLSTCLLFASASAQDFSVFREGQTTDEQAQMMVDMVKDHIAQVYPYYQETKRWNLSPDPEEWGKSGPIAHRRISYGCSPKYFWYDNNAAKLFAEITEEANLTFSFVDLNYNYFYQMEYIQEDCESYIVLYFTYEYPGNELEYLMGKGGQ